ncbi:Protein of unknown function (DUF2975) [Novosphingobium kunmingense]|uniref:DUF2975 family protein n=1 Tax=Novosphingobium kunmingense TaxID=1211806 RepID=A0A2N0HJW3_9SPHN|nr:DUF2975 domain-containing protein [Novosphingobium kunmingense]PKB19243.1 Protein of unknown function (DUF2975) [Novosphingobium kunmingense]
MPHAKPDALLGFAKAFVSFLIVLAWIVLAVMALTTVALGGAWAVQHPDLIREMAKNMKPGAELWEAMTALLLILALVAAMAAMALRWLQKLKAIIDSVSLGDPFAPENADRLRAMGWLTVAIELTSTPVGALGEWLARTFKDATSDFGLSLGGLLLAMVLFILARVFREGAAMRADLEGTV